MTWYTQTEDGVWHEGVGVRRDVIGTDVKLACGGWRRAQVESTHVPEGARRCACAAMTVAEAAARVVRKHDRLLWLEGDLVRLTAKVAEARLEWRDATKAFDDLKEATK